MEEEHSEESPKPAPAPSRGFLPLLPASTQKTRSFQSRERTPYTLSKSQIRQIPALALVGAANLLRGGPKRDPGLQPVKVGRPCPPSCLPRHSPARPHVQHGRRGQATSTSPPAAPFSNTKLTWPISRTGGRLAGSGGPCEQVGIPLQAWRKYDTDRSGYIEANELKVGWASRMV